MPCPSCGKENTDAARFCEECAAELARVCASCGTSNSPTAKFCNQCRAALTTSPPSAAPEAKQPAPAPLPASFAGGRYAVRRFLGEGAKKRAFEAHDTLLDRDVAVAVIKTEGLDSLGRQRVTQEAQALGRLGAHPNIVSVFDLGEHDGQPFIVTELMAGDVAAALREAGGPLPLERTLKIATEACRGLEFAHAQSVVHRDLKPGNVWLTTEGVAKIGDFGLAVSLDRSRLTQQGMIVGTVSYMPPEQALGGDITPRSDLYALGAMLYEMVAGRTPFPGDDPTAVISQHISVPPVAPSWYTEHCPPDLEELILHLLAKDPDARPQSAAEVLAALERVDPAQRSASHSESNVLDRLARGVFVGREQELQRLHRAYDEAFAGRGSLLMLVGEPGIGKTRTVQELETYARIRGGQALWGAAHEAAGAPAYWPWVQVGRMYGSSNDVTELAPDMQGKEPVLVSIFPELRAGGNVTEPEALDDPEAAQFRLFDAYATFVRAMAKRAPLIIAIDDLHWADKPTLLLLQHLARELSHMRVLVVGTYRDTDLVRGHPLSEALATLNRSAGFQRVVLRGLSRDEVAGYIRSVANLEPSRPVVERIFEETEGNPFFLSEVVNLMAQEGTLTANSVSDIGVPDGVREALGRRLDRISEEANELLQVAAVIGREFAYDTLTLLGERDENELLRLIEEGLEARVIEEMEQTGRYRFTHALMQETLLGELSTTRRVRLHGQVGEALERRWGARADERASRLAQHFAEAAMVTPRHAAKAVRYSKLAAQQAEAQAAWGEAAKRYEDCLTLVSEAEDALGQDEAALLTALGICALNAGEYRASWRALMRARTFYQQRGDPAGLARATLEALAVIAPPQRHLALVQEALAVLGEGEPHLEARLLVPLSGGLANLLDAAEAERARARLSQLMTKHGFEDVRPQILMTDGFRAADARALEDAASLFREAYERFAQLGQAGAAASALTTASAPFLDLGRLDEALRVLEEGHKYSREHHIRWHEEATAAGIASVLLARCEFEAFDALAEEHASDAAFPIHAHRAGRAEAAGDHERAVALLPDPAVVGGRPDFTAQIHGLRARVLLNAGQERAAREEFSRLRETLQMVPGATAIGSSFHWLDEAFLSLADEAHMEAVESAIRESVKSGRVPYFDPFAGRCGYRTYGAVLRLRGRVDEAEQLLRSALAWCERERCPIEAGRCLQGLAEIAERRGNGAEALQLLDQAGELFRQHGAKSYLEQVITRKLQIQGVPSTNIHRSIEAVTLAVESERPDISVHAAPDGKVTLMFSDIEDSTPLAERLGDEAWVDLLHEHNGIFRQQIAEHHGHEVKTIGDAFMVAFQLPANALRCAVAIQSAFAAYNKEHPQQPLQVRIGLHTGDAVRDAGDFHGTNVILASRIADEACGGEILISSTFRELVDSTPEAEFGAVREVALKGLSGKHHVQTVEWSQQRAL